MRLEEMRQQERLDEERRARDADERRFDFFLCMGELAIQALAVHVNNSAAANNAARTTNTAVACASDGNDGNDEEYQPTDSDTEE
jgi:hypothetical protein